jgi:hypothetical protein
VAATRRAQFTVEQANSSLVLVKRIVTDIVREFARLMECQRRAELADERGSRQQRERARQQVRHAFGRMQQLRDELEAMGVELKDWARGIVHFPARIDGKPVYLCWRHGEQRVGCWHERNAGFCDRKRFDDYLPFGVFESDGYWGVMKQHCPRAR